ncbi:HAD family hydrolase [Nitrosospira sp. Nsp14]|uniref:HAD family hydrolase n=1 Tax=Nitrosospira sp. Nsp14 TaxID=1855333 RepID=UPI0015A72AFF|nr:HAD family phosphatase [Nitrosospira sp. Nsp14]
MDMREIPSSGIAFVLDADNTLWDTDRVYRKAHLWLLAEIEREFRLTSAEIEDRLQFVRIIDQELATKHHLGLRYPARLLVKALATTLNGLDRASAIRSAIFEGIESDHYHFDYLATEFDRKIREIPELRDQVACTVEQLYNNKIPMVVATESSAQQCSVILKKLGLEKFIDSVIAAPKSPELFLRIANKLHLPGSSCFVVGDQLDRDIAPAMQIGFTGIYFPGGFSPNWTLSFKHVKPQYVISSFAEIPKIIETASEIRLLS